MSDQTSKSSDSIGVSAAEVAGMGAGSILTGVSLTCGTTADATVTIYDNTAASGLLVYNVRLDASVEGVYNFDLLPNIKLHTGAFITVTGTGAIVIVYYK